VKPRGWGPSELRVSVPNLEVGDDAMLPCWSEMGFSLFCSGPEMDCSVIWAGTLVSVGWAGTLVSVGWAGTQSGSGSGN